ncbi:regulator of ribonuclease activity A [Nakamurella sp. UYEF19]|uniref:ribonuclease E activity regulator RraA n=1 Tax=Nakamurella sp. UYEF19 TaxID=1756392 RepID=UPI00339295F6
MSTTSTADLSDECGESLEYCDTPFRSYGRRAAFAGMVSTVRCFEDILLVRSILGTPGHGGVLVVDGGGSSRVALLGDQMALLAIDHGWAGVIINGAVRDTAVLSDLDLGVKALAASPRRGGKGGAGERDVPVSFGGATFRPGDQVVSDADGIVVQAVR